MWWDVYKIVKTDDEHKALSEERDVICMVTRSCMKRPSRNTLSTPLIIVH